MPDGSTFVRHGTCPILVSELFECPDPFEGQVEDGRLDVGGSGKASSRNFPTYWRMSRCERAAWA